MVAVARTSIFTAFGEQANRNISRRNHGLPRGATVTLTPAALGGGTL